MLFVREALGAEPDPWQIDVLEALAHEGARIAIRSGHGVGKSALMSWCILWYISTRKPVRIPCTANTSSQLHDVLWSELSKWHGAFKQRWPIYAEQLDIKSDRIFWRDSPHECFGVARTSRREKPDALQGFHCENILFVLDEAQGIHEKVFEVAEGALSTHGARVIMTGNPVYTSGYFHRAFHRDRDQWTRFRVNCEETPRADPKFIERMKAMYGEDSDIYAYRVRGDFPSASSMQFISMEDIEACLAYRAEPQRHQPIILGIDVARFGDDRTVMIVRHGQKVYHPQVFRGLDTMSVAGKSMDLAAQVRADYVVVDGTGLGAGVVDRLKQLRIQSRVIDINFASKAVDEKSYSNKRTEIWGRMRVALKKHSTELPDVQELIDDLIAPEGVYCDKGMMIEKKERTKDRGLASPDIGDALALTYEITERQEPMAQAERLFEARRKTAIVDYNYFGDS